MAQEKILQGLQKVKHRGRLDFLAENLLIDGAHNEDSLKKLSDFLKTQEKKFKNIQLCFALKKKKNLDLFTKIF